ncbi:MAG: hypothetical protein OXI73_08780 [Rhodospirillales bacterium]|nr:hypothetical protein [Rhodospirillales bacterium]
MFGLEIAWEMAMFEEPPQAEFTNDAREEWTHTPGAAMVAEGRILAGPVGGIGLRAPALMRW